jgi:polyphosphate kinase
VSHDTIRRFLRDELELVPDQIYEIDAPVEFSDLKPIWSLERPPHRYKAFVSAVPEGLRDKSNSIFSVIRKGDLLVHHPYESFEQTVQRFVATAADDPKVVAIKMTLYRTGTDTPFVPHLIRAAEQGKQVVCLVELNARFDEERNIRVARLLEEAGVHVVYGMLGYKTHCKMTMVVRRESGGIRTYGHIGTGNYHAETAQLYTDLGLFTADARITRELVHLFHYLTGRSLFDAYEHLAVAPLNLRARFSELIRREMHYAQQGKPARIVAKMNSLEDPDIIRRLYQASAAGVSIDLIVRGSCCLRAQVPGLSDNIRVRSVIGRYLEHSRIYYFQQGAQEVLDGSFWIGSADWMMRNLDRRVEAVAPVMARPLRGELWATLMAFLEDERQSWSLGADGTYTKLGDPQAKSPGVQQRLMASYGRGADGRAFEPASASVLTARTRLPTSNLKRKKAKTAIPKSKSRSDDKKQAAEQPLPKASLENR